METISKGVATGGGAVSHPTPHPEIFKNMENSSKLRVVCGC